MSFKGGLKNMGGPLLIVIIFNGTKSLVRYTDGVAKKLPSTAIIGL